MCNLCSNDQQEREKAQKHAMYISERLTHAARFYEDMAHGLEKGHSDRAKNFTHTATMLIRALVEDWV
jgi:hypothetical protein